MNGGALKKDSGFLLVCTPAKQALRLSIGLHPSQPSSEAPPPRSLQGNCKQLLSRPRIWVGKFPQEQVSVGLHPHCQPELAKGLAPGAFCVKGRKLWACCFCRVGRPQHGDFNDAQTQTGSLTASRVVSPSSRTQAPVLAFPWWARPQSSGSTVRRFCLERSLHVCWAFGGGEVSQRPSEPRSCPCRPQTQAAQTGPSPPALLSADSWREGTIGFPQ